MADGSRSSSAQKSTSAWVRVAMPSIADLIFVALLSVLVFTSLSVRLLGDAGIGWHIRTGQQILATHRIPRQDSFSSTMGGRPWFAWEWLYDLLVGQLEARLGLNGVVWLTAMVIGAVFAWTFRLLIKRGTNVFVALVLVLLAVSASMIHFLARPHVVSWLFTLVWFVILDASERDCFDERRGEPSRWLWALPALMLVWVNVHGGFLIGFVLLGIFWVTALGAWLTTKESRLEEVLAKISAGRRARDLMWVGLLSAAASLVNPYGWKLHQHVYGYLSNRFLMDHIEEFQSPNFHGVAQKCFAFLVLSALAALGSKAGQLRRSHILTLLFAVYTGLYSSRNIPVSSVLLVMVVAPLLSQIGLGQKFSQRMTAIESGQRGHAGPILAIVVTFLIALHGGRIRSNLLMDAHFSSKRMPVEAVNHLERNQVRGPMLSPDYWGGYLIYRFYPKTRVVVDDRHDLYGEEFLKSYLRMVHVEPGWADFLREQEISCVLMPKDAALTNMLVASAGWKVIYTDEVAIAFVPASVNR